MRAQDDVPRAVELLFLTRLDRSPFLEEKEYVELEQAVTLVIDGLVKTVSDAVARQVYLAAGAPA
jgi:hypothetical protein